MSVTDNEIRVVPKLSMSDAAIERKVREIVKSEECFRDAQLVVRVTIGEVVLKGSFVGYRDPSILKHKMAEIEGVSKTDISAVFPAYSGASRDMTGSHAG